MSQFEDLGLNPSLAQALTEIGYETPTPIQAQAIPLALQGKDIIGCAQTGTGKTAAFALPILQLFPDRSEKPRALILAPTRELACQIEESFQSYGKHLPARVCVLYGGVGIKGQIQQLRKGVDLIVATPGRLMDHLERRTVDLSGVQVLVLDEADRMLDMGFEPQVRAIVRSVPKERQTLLFSATVPPAIQSLARRYMHAPAQVAVERSGATVEKVDQRVHMVSPEQKADLLLQILEQEKPTSALIFTRTKRGSEKVARLLHQKGLRAAAMHGDLTQSQRVRVIDKFRSNRVRLLVATDVAARGLDIPNISHVINFDVPENAEDYVHRIGRTARADRDGVAITLASAKDEAALAGIERLIAQHIKRDHIEGFEYQVDTSGITAQTQRGGGRNSRRTDMVLAFLENRYGKTARATR